MSDVFRPQGGMFQGNMPPELQKAIEQEGSGGRSDARAALNAAREAQEAQAEKELEQRNQQRRVVETMARGPEAMIAGNSPLQDVLDKLSRQGITKFESVSLPSKGKFYTGELASGIVHIRRMTGSDEEILATPRFIRKNEAIDMILQKCIREKFDPKEILVIDRTYLLIYLRGISFSTKYEIEVTCPTTEKKFKTAVDLSALPIDYCADDFDKSSLEGTLPVSGFHYRYRLATNKDDQKVADHRERRIKLLGDNAADDTLTFRTALLVEELEGLTDPDDIQTLLKRLPIEDVGYLRSIINDPPFGVDTQLSIVSPYSAEEFTMELPLEASFFFPRFSKKEQEAKK